MTTIEWTDRTWNPTTGCDRVSAGCDNCYALTLAKRLKGMGQPKYQRDGNPRTSGPGFGISAHADVLAAPYTWKTPQKEQVDLLREFREMGDPAPWMPAGWDPTPSLMAMVNEIRETGVRAGRELDGRTWDEFPQEVSA